MFYKPITAGGGVSSDDCVAILAGNENFPRVSFEKVPATSVLIDPNGNYNISTKRYVVPADGEYFVIVHLGVNYVANGTLVRCSLYKNGAPIGNTGKSVGVLNDEATKLVNQANKLTLSAGDYLEAYGYHDNAAARTFDIAKYDHGLTVVRLS